MGEDATAVAEAPDEKPKTLPPVTIEADILVTCPACKNSGVIRRERKTVTLTGDATKPLVSGAFNVMLDGKIIRAWRVQFVADAGKGASQCSVFCHSKDEKGQIVVCKPCFDEMVRKQQMIRQMGVRRQ